METLERAAEETELLGALELLDRAGHVQHRVRVHALPFRIGRALDNDLVLDDPYACPYHAEVRTDDAGVALFDLSSVNGSFHAQQPARAQRIALGERTDLRLGHTMLRFRPAREQLPATAVDPIASSRLFALDRALWAFAALLLVLLAIAAEHVLGHAKPIKIGAVAGAVLPAGLVFALWALAWALVNRMVAHRFHYFGHLSVVAIGALTSSLAETVLGYGGYAIGIGAIEPIQILANTAVLGLIVYGHLRLISRGSGRKLLIPAALVAAGFLALTVLPDIGKDQFTREPSLKVALKPPAAALRAGRDGDTFYSAASVALDAADAAVDERIDGGGDPSPAVPVDEEPDRAMGDGS